MGTSEAFDGALNTQDRSFIRTVLRPLKLCSKCQGEGVGGWGGGVGGGWPGKWINGASLRSEAGQCPIPTKLKNKVRPYACTRVCVINQQRLEKYFKKKVLFGTFRFLSAYPFYKIDSRRLEEKSVVHFIQSSVEFASHRHGFLAISFPAHLSGLPLISGGPAPLGTSRELLMQISVAGKCSFADKNLCL